MATHHLEGVAAIEVVGVDDGEGFVYHILGHEYGVVGTPRFLATFGHTEACRQAVELLVDILHGNAASEVVGVDVAFELVGKRMADYEDHLAEAGAYGILDAVVHDYLAVGANAVHLLQPTVAAAHAGSQDK